MEGHGQEMKKENVVIKDTRDGILVFLDDQEEWKKVMLELTEKLRHLELEQVEKGQAILDLGGRDILPLDLSSLGTVFAEHGLLLQRIIARPGRQQVPQGRWEFKRPRGRIVRQRPASREKAGTEIAEGDKGADGAARERPGTGNSGHFLGGERSAAEEAGGGNTLLLRRTLRSGQSVQYPGNVVIMGDVNPGAEVIAGGSIVVLGWLKGVAHAGALGDETSAIMALRLRPTQLRIAGHITRPPEGEDAGPEAPEIACIREGMVVIERY